MTSLENLDDEIKQKIEFILYEGEKHGRPSKIVDLTNGVKVKEGRFRPDDLYSADEVFISSTTMELMPVTQINKIRIGAKPGRITRMLHKAYKEKVKEYSSKSLKGNRVKKDK